MGLANFLLRLVAYALLTAVAARLAAFEWSALHVDGRIGDVAALASVQHVMSFVFLAAPIVAALAGMFARNAAVFVGWFAVGVILSAPFALVRAAG